jgi:hypothetical protein
MGGRTGRGPEVELSDADRDVLRAVGVRVDIDEAEALEAAARHRDQLVDALQEMRSAALTLEDFGAVAGIPVGDVRELISNGDLWVFQGDAAPLVPGWAVHSGRPLDGVDELAHRIRPGMHPVAVDRWMHTENPDLVVDGSPVSVLEWLRAGGSPSAAGAAMGDPSELG